MIGKKQRKEKVDVVGAGRKSVRIRYNGVYNLDALLKAITNWFNVHKYAPVLIEHTEGVKTSGVDMKIRISPFKSVNEYIRFFIYVEIFILRGVDVIVEQNGKQIKKQRGDLEIRVRSWLHKNYRLTFKGKGKEFFRRTYEAYIIKDQLSAYEDKLLAETQQLLDVIGEILGKIKR